MLSAGRPGIFTIQHFNRYPAVLAQLSEVQLPDLQEVLEDGWLSLAPRHLADEYLAGR